MSTINSVSSLITLIPDHNKTTGITKPIQFYLNDKINYKENDISTDNNIDILILLRYNNIGVLRKTQEKNHRFFVQYILFIAIILLGVDTMRKSMKENLIEIFRTLYEAHNIIRNYIDDDQHENAYSLLADCQDTAIQLGNLIAESEGDGLSTITYLEEYCEAVYETATNLSDGCIGEDIRKKLDTILGKAEAKANDEIKVRLEVVFMPYKASMWDSLESVWKAADADPECDAYVVPIPYYDRNPDRSLGKFHYEGGDLPAYVPVTHYTTYDLEQRCPDAIYIHNPYDGYNFVTSVHPNYYSEELKKHTDCLVYIPYYATSGGMSQGQKALSAYYHADHIVTQSEDYRIFFDPALPQSKFLPFGSPKFDRAIEMCSNPPEPPAAWKSRMAGKKTYFYNTSLSGLLQNTEVFMKKMQSVFETFAAHPDVCLLWRPHPLLETTLDSMRPQFRQYYNALKEFFLKNDLGIYDTTPDVTNAVAQCDAYIGDTGSSVISLFGVAGKPIFILNNHINTKPGKGSHKNHINLTNGPVANNDTDWLIVKGSYLYHWNNEQNTYRFFCRLSEYSHGGSYQYIITTNGKTYICPSNAQDIIVIGDNGIERRIPLKPCQEESGNFYGAVSCGKYILLIPNNYPAIVRYDTETDSITYLSQNCRMLADHANGGRAKGGFCTYNGCLYAASAVDNKILKVDIASGKETVVKAGNANSYYMIVPHGEYLWLFSYSEGKIVRWNPETKATKEYSCYPNGFECSHYLSGFKCAERPFGIPAFYDNYIYLPPAWGNMFVKLNTETGKVSEWKPSVNIPMKAEIGYFLLESKSFFIQNDELYSQGKAMLHSVYDRRLYMVDLRSENIEELPFDISESDLRDNEEGFAVASPRLQYCCIENTFNYLSDFIEDKLTGQAFDKEKQLAAYSTINASPDGDCGIKVHEYIKKIM